MTTIRFRRTYLTPSECARRFVDDLLERRNLTESMSSLILPSYLSSLLNIAENYLEHQRSLFLSIVAEIGSLCSQKSYDRVHYLISVLDELMDLHQEEKYRAVIENYLETIVYADLTDHFISYPIQLQVQIMSIVENSPILQFPLIRDQSESDQSKIDLFLQDAARYFHNVSSRTCYRRLVFRLVDHSSSQQSIVRALIIGSLFLPLTCHSGFLTELYSLLSFDIRFLSSTNMETFFHVLCPTGINQFYSVPRVYLCQLLIARLCHVDTYFGQILHICFVVHQRVPQIRVDLRDVIEPLTEKKGFRRYLDQQEEEFNQSRRYDQQDVSLFEPFFRQIRERIKRGFRLKQFCRMKIRSRLAENSREDLLTQVQQLKELSEKNHNYLTYDLNRLLTDPDRFYQSTRETDEPVWNSSIPPPPVN